MTDRIAELEALLGKATADVRLDPADQDFIVDAHGKSLLRGWDDGSAWFTNSNDAALFVALRNNAEALIACARLLRTERGTGHSPEWLDAYDAALAKLDGEVK